MQPLEPRGLPPRARAVLGGVEQPVVEVSTIFRENKSIFGKRTYYLDTMLNGHINNPKGYLGFGQKVHSPKIVKTFAKFR